MMRFTFTHMEILHGPIQIIRDWSDNSNKFPKKQMTTATLIHSTNIAWYIIFLLKLATLCMHAHVL